MTDEELLALFTVERWRRMPLTDHDLEEIREEADAKRLRLIVCTEGEAAPTE